MWCVGGDEMWGVSGQGGLRMSGVDEVGVGSWSIFIPFDFHLVFVLPQVHADQNWNVWKRDIKCRIVRAEKIMSNTVKEFYIKQISTYFRAIDDSKKSWPALMIWFVIHHSMLFTYLHFWQSPASSQSNHISLGQLYCHEMPRWDNCII